MPEQFNGRVKWFKNAYGYIIREDGQEFFVHFSEIQGQPRGQRTLIQGQNVTFGVQTDAKNRLQACDVRVIA